MQRLRVLTEEECYLRCYGWIGEDDDVRIVAPEDEQTHEDAAVLTDRIRRAFEARLDAREPEAA